MKLATMALLPLLILTGCADIQYHPYVGQQPAWPTVAGGFVNQDQSLPIYDSFPSQPYQVLGALNITTDQHGDPDRWAAATGRQRHADALLLLNSHTRYLGTVKTTDAFAWAYGHNSSTTVTSYSSPRYRLTRTYIAIQFTTNPPP